MHVIVLEPQHLEDAVPHWMPLLTTHKVTKIPHLNYKSIMPKLWDMPYELMDEIILELEDDKLALCQLARAASWLNRLVRPFLFRNLKVKFPYPSQSTNRMAKDIIRVYEASIDLQRVVQSLSLRLETSAPITPALVTATWMVYQEANKFLGKFPLLQSLEIHSTGSSYSFWPEFLETNAMKHLTRLDLHDICLDPAHLLAYMMIENINHISVSSMRVVKPGALVYSPTLIPRTSPVKSLDLGSSFPIAEELLEWLLQWPRGLETLVCNLSGRNHDYLQHFGTYRYGYWGQLVTSPRAIARSLASCKHSLLTLDIRIEASRESYDQTRLDMSDFEVLQTLIVPCRLLFGSSMAHQSRDGMFQLLPRSLLELEIDFNYQEGIVSVTRPHVANGSGARIAGIECAQDRQIHWILEVAINKTARYPKFRCLSLLERAKMEYFTDYLLPQHVKSAFDENDIAFIGVCRNL